MADALNRRIRLFDALRGFALVNMIAYHGVYDWVSVFGRPAGWFVQTDYARGWQQAICWTFLLVAGAVFPYGRRPLQRAALVFGCGMLLTDPVRRAASDWRVDFDHGAAAPYTGKASVTAGSGWLLCAVFAFARRSQRNRGLWSVLCHAAARAVPIAGAVLFGLSGAGLLFGRLFSHSAVAVFVLDGDVFLALFAPARGGMAARQKDLPAAGMAGPAQPDRLSAASARFAGRRFFVDAAGRLGCCVKMKEVFPFQIFSDGFARRTRPASRRVRDQILCAPDLRLDIAGAMPYPYSK